MSGLKILFKRYNKKKKKAARQDCKIQIRQKECGFLSQRYLACKTCTDIWNILASCREALPTDMSLKLCKTLQAESVQCNSLSTVLHTMTFVFFVCISCESNKATIGFLEKKKMNNSLGKCVKKYN